jgi:hypothetical protein
VATRGWPTLGTAGGQPARLPPRPLAHCPRPDSMPRRTGPAPPLGLPGRLLIPLARANQSSSPFFDLLQSPEPPKRRSAEELRRLSREALVRGMAGSLRNAITMMVTLSPGVPSLSVRRCRTSACCTCKHVACGGAGPAQRGVSSQHPRLPV